MIRRPCIDCGALTGGASRCGGCTLLRDLARARRPHYASDYQARARLLRAKAAADPLTRCRRCGGLARPGDPWQAGHVRDGDPASPLAPEHTSCNASAGADITNGKVPR